MKRAGVRLHTRCFYMRPIKNRRPGWAAVCQCIPLQQITWLQP